MLLSLRRTLRTTILPLLTGLGLSLALTSGCGSKVQSGTSGGNTSWLQRCSSDTECGSGLCARGACAQTCSGNAECSNLAQSTCVETISNSECPLTATRLCAPHCEHASDCKDIGDGYSCINGACTADCQNTDSTPDASPSASALVTAIPMDADTGCDYQGEHHDPGEVFGACDQCSCVGGEFSCLEQPCAEDACVIDGVTYQPGETYIVVDGCKECVCGGGCTDAICDGPAPSSTALVNCTGPTCLPPQTDAGTPDSGPEPMLPDSGTDPQPPEPGDGGGPCLEGQELFYQGSGCNGSVVPSCRWPSTDAVACEGVVCACDGTTVYGCAFFHPVPWRHAGGCLEVDAGDGGSLPVCRADGAVTVCN